MAAITTLQMAFALADGKKRVMSVTPVKPTVTEAQVRAFMDALIAGNALNWEPAEKVGATLTERTVNELFTIA